MQKLHFIKSILNFTNDEGGIYLYPTVLPTLTRFRLRLVSDRRYPVVDALSL